MSRLSGTYELCIGNFDWGCAVDKVIVKLDAPIDGIEAEALTVTEHKMVTEPETEEYDIHEEFLKREVLAAYLCDEKGVRKEGPSDQFAIELQVGPETGSPLVCRGKHGIFRWSHPYELLIEAEGMEIARTFTKKTTKADVFIKDTYISTSGVSYLYAAYNPEQESDILLVWLHGLGEGQAADSCAYLPLLGHKGTRLSEGEFQNLFGGIHILVPQCPTYWMDADGKASNFADKRILATADSYYRESLEELIDHYAKKVGAKKILLAGCSNGGFMSLVLAMHRPEKYLAAVPICEAVPDVSITDGQIEKLTRIPLYFIYCIKDPIVDPEVHEIPTIERLKAAGHENLMVYQSSKVIDTSGNYKQADGSPYEYMSHLSWIHFDNNETEDGEKLGVWEWMKACLEG